MVAARARWLIVGGTAVVAAICGLGFWLTRPGPYLAPDQEQAYTMMPAVTAYLDSQAYWPYLSGIVGSPAPDKPGQSMWLCGASIEDVRPDGAGWVESAVQEPAGPGASDWVSQHFSADAAAAINHGRTPVASLPGSDALPAFGCSATSASYSGPAGPYWLCQHAWPAGFEAATPLIRRQKNYALSTLSASFPSQSANASVPAKVSSASSSSRGSVSAPWSMTRAYPPASRAARSAGMSPRSSPA